MFLIDGMVFRTAEPSFLGSTRENSAQPSQVVLLDLLASQNGCTLQNRAEISDARGRSGGSPESERRRRPERADDTGELQALADRSLTVRRLADLKGGASARHVVQRVAGTKPNVPSNDGQYRIKLSSEREAFAYENEQQLGLATVLPGYQQVQSYTLTDGTVVPGNGPQLGASEAQVAQVTTANGVIVLSRSIDQPKGTQRLLVIDVVGRTPHGGAAPTKLFLDIKIGSYTKSGEQFKLEGASVAMRWIKYFEHNLKDSDLQRGSRNTGYDIDADNLTEFENFYSLAIGPAPPVPGSRASLKAAMGVVTPYLNDIRRRIRVAPVRFVGSSLFVVLNVTSPASSDARLIDPDHPIIDTRTLPNPLPALPGTLMTDQSYVATPDRSWADYWNKWQGSFDTGIDNFIDQWWAQKSNAL